jgi:hypothetical protein
MKPLLLIDVDGVLNPYAAESCPEGYRDFDFFEGEEPVRLADIHGKWLRDLATLFDLAWATDWGDEAHRLISPVLGLRKYPVIVFPPTPFAPAEKVPAVRDFAGDRPVVWVDDVVTPEAERWAAERGTPTLLLRADPVVGLTEELVSRARAWAEELTQQ